MGIVKLDINPIRFYSNANTIDWDNYFPNDHNMELRENYFPGEYEQSYYPTHIKSKAIYLQFGITGISDLTLVVTKPDTTTENITPTNISPSGWVGDPAYLYTYTPNTEGLYRFEFAEGDTISDQFYVIDSSKLRKQLLQVQYYNSENDFNTVFYADEILKFAPTAYVSGMIESGVKNEKSTFETDRGEVTTRRATPVPTATIKIEAHRTQLPLINLMFSCDNIIINGIGYQNPDTPETEKTEKTDMYIVTVSLSEINYNYYRK